MYHVPSSSSVTQHGKSSFCSGNVIIIVSLLAGTLQLLLYDIERRATFSPTKLGSKNTDYILGTLYLHRVCQAFGPFIGSTILYLEAKNTACLHLVSKINFFLPVTMENVYKFNLRGHSDCTFQVFVLNLGFITPWQFSINNN